MFFTKVLPFSIFLGSFYLFKGRFPPLLRLFDKMVFWIIIFVGTVVSFSIGMDEVIWDKAQFEELSERPPSGQFETFRSAFMVELFALAALNPGEMKDDVRIFLEAFTEKTVQIHRGDDADVRPIYVSAQGDFERTMAYLLDAGKIDHLIGIIHTPTPATPLCTEGAITRDLVAESMEDHMRLFTVMKRPEIIREFLAKGGILIAAYPEGGRERRTREQLAIYDSLRETYPQNLIDLPLHCIEMEKEMVGATYFFHTIDDDWLAFGIMATQANAPEDDRVWGMWFGPIQDPQVFLRTQSVFDYLHQTQNRDLSDLLFIR